MELENASQGSFRFTTWIDHRLTRIGLVSRFHRDCALAACVTIASLAVGFVMLSVLDTIADIPLSTTHTIVLITVICIQSAVICLRRTTPALCLVLVATCQVLILAMLPPDVSNRGIATFIIAYTVGTLWSTRSTIAMVVVAVGIETAGGLLSIMVRPELATLLGTTQPAAGSAHSQLALTAGDFASSALVYTIASFVGLHVAMRRRQIQLVKTHAAETIKAQQAKAEAAGAAERSRLARELHDIAAHHLSGMVVQASAVERLIDRDPIAAREATAWVRSQGKETLKNLRLVVGILRERGEYDRHDEPGGNNAPVPGLADLDALVDNARQLGNPVTVVRLGRFRELPPIADVTLYRAAQEGLSNARQYAPTEPVRLTLRYDQSHVELNIDNDIPAGAGDRNSDSRQGLGLIGMHERVELVGGTLSTGPTTTGGWRVAVTVPDMVPESGGCDPDPARPAAEPGAYPDLPRGSGTQ